MSRFFFSIQLYNIFSIIKKSLIIFTYVVSIHITMFVNSKVLNYCDMKSLVMWEENVCLYIFFTYVKIITIVSSDQISLYSWLQKNGK
jgi:hypothetical protein